MDWYTSKATPGDAYNYAHTNQVLAVRWMYMLHSTLWTPAKYTYNSPRVLAFVAFDRKRRYRHQYSGLTDSFVVGIELELLVFISCCFTQSVVAIIT